MKNTLLTVGPWKADPFRVQQGGGTILAGADEGVLALAAAAPEMRDKLRELSQMVRQARDAASLVDDAVGRAEGILENLDDLDPDAIDALLRRAEGWPA